MSQAPHVLFLDTGEGIGGGQVRLLAHMRRLEEEGLRSSAIVSASNRSLVEKLEASGHRFRALSLNLEIPRWLRTVVRQRRAIQALGLVNAPAVRARILGAVRSVSPDLLVCFTFKAALYAAWMRRAFPVPTVYAALSALDTTSHGPLDRYVVGAADAMIYNSEHTRRSFAHLPVVHRKPGEVVYSLVEDPRRELDPAAGEALRTSLGIDTSARVVGFLGRVNPRKRVEDFIDMAIKVRESVPRTRFLVVGGSSTGEHPRYAEQIMSYARTRLGEQIHFAGHVDRPADYLALFDLLVLPSIAEPMGRVLIEALYLGVPIIATTPGGSDEIFAAAGGACGTQVPPRDPAALARAAVAILERREREPGAYRCGVPLAFRAESITRTEAAFYRAVVGRCASAPA